MQWYSTKLDKRKIANSRLTDFHSREIGKFANSRLSIGNFAVFWTFHRKTTNFFNQGLRYWNFGMSWNFRVLDDFGLDRTWTCGTQFVWFSVSCHEFCMSFHFCCMTCLWVSYAWKPLWSGLQFCEELCMQTVGFGLSLRFATSLHYFCFVWDIEVWSITYYLSRCAARILG